MASNQVEICNLALGMVGAGRIASMTDASKEARACNTIFDPMRDEVLEAYPWSFARSRAVLVQVSAAPAFGFVFAYALPTDCLWPLALDNPDAVYNVEGDRLLTSEPYANLTYVRRVTDPAQFTPSFVSCLAARMAVELAMDVAKSSQMSLELMRVYERKAALAMTVNAMYDVIAAPSSSPYTEARD